jgi:hypothetical protein
VFPEFRTLPLVILLIDAPPRPDQGALAQPVMPEPGRFKFGECVVQHRLTLGVWRAVRLARRLRNGRHGRAGVAPSSDQVVVQSPQLGQEWLGLFDELRRQPGRRRGGILPGRPLASASDDATEIVWGALAGQELLTFRGHSVRSAGLVFSPDGRRLAIGQWNGTIQIRGAFEHEKRAVAEAKM